MKPRLSELEYEVVWDGTQRGTIQEALARVRLGEPEPPRPVVATRRDEELEATSILALLESTAPRAYGLPEIAAAFGVDQRHAWPATGRLLDSGLVERIPAPRADARKPQLWLYRLRS